MKFPPSRAGRRRIKKDFSLGMEEFGDPWSDVGESDSEDFQPTKKKLKSTQKKLVQSLQQVALELPPLRISWKSYLRVLHLRTPRKMIPGLKKFLLIG